MKKELFVLFYFGLSISMSCQNIFVPNGTVGTTTSPLTGVGINISQPEGKLDIKTSASNGGLKIINTTSYLGGIPTLTPYAFKVHVIDNATQPPANDIVAFMKGDGELNLGIFSSVSTQAGHKLNVRNKAGIYFNSDTYISLQSTALGNIFNWNSNAVGNEQFKNLNFTFNNGTPHLSLTSVGKVGIGIQNPSTALHIVDNTAANSGGNFVHGIQISNNGWRNEDHALYINTGAGNIFRLTNAGYLYLGSNLNGAFFADYRLYVENGIRTEKIRVDIAADNGWADFVFDDDYKLMPITELVKFIAMNRHLPNVPSEKQVRGGHRPC